MTAADTHAWPPAWARDLVPGAADIDQASLYLAVEAGGYLEKLLDPARDKAELDAIAERREHVDRLPRAVTPIAARCEAKPLASSAPTIVLPNAPPMERRNSSEPVAAPISRCSAAFCTVTRLLGITSPRAPPRTVW